MKNILLIAGEPTAARLIQSLLSHAGPEAFTTDLATQLDAALAQLAHTNFDAILLDLNLPNGQGLATLHPVQAAAPNTPVIALVHLQDESLAVAAVEAGAQDYLIADHLTQLKVIHTLRHAIEHHRRAVELQAQAIAAELELARRERAEAALRESEARFRAYIERSPEGMFVADETGRFRDANPAASELVGYTREELLHLTIFDLVPPEEVGAARARFEKLQAGSALGGELRLRRKDGTVTPVLWNVAKLPDGNSVFFCTDISEFKRSEQALRESEERFRTVANFTYDWEYWMGADGNLIYCSPSCERITGYRAKAFLQQPGLLQSIVHPADRDKFADHLRAERATGETGGVDFRILTASGEERWINHFCQPVYGADGRCLGRRASSRDITERKQVEAALYESSQRFRALLRQAPLPSAIYRLIYDAQGNVVDWEISDINALGAANMGLTVETAIGKRMVALFGEAMMAPHFEISRQVATIGQPVQFEAYFAGNGHYYLVSDYLIDANHYANVNIDITDVKQAQAELQASREQLRALARHAQTARESERTFIAREIHDELGQELTGLKMDVAWLGRHLAGDEERLRHRIAAMSDQIDATIQSVRRIAAELRPWLLDELGLAAALQWQAHEFEARTEIACDLTVAQEVPFGRDLATVFFRVCQEALTNVARHAHARHVTIRLQPEANEWVLSICDDGVGISEDQVTSPSAMGLVGMRERVRPWGGAVQITSQPGQGTTVTVSVQGDVSHQPQDQVERTV